MSSLILTVTSLSSKSNDQTEQSRPLNRLPKILGVTLDIHLTLPLHESNVADRARQRFSILKALAGTMWGQQNDTLLPIYKILINLLFTHASSTLFPNSNNSTIQKLQTVVCIARIATGCVKISPIKYLHNVSKILTVRSHLSLMCTQYLITCFQPDHPSYATVKVDSEPISMKKTRQSELRREVGDFLEKVSSKR